MDTPTQSPSHYTWEVAGKAFSVQFDFDCVDRLSMEIMRGFGLVPKRGAEIGGVLLGTVEIGDKVIIRVEDFEVVHCDYLRGPSFLLSPADEQRFASAVKRHEGGADRRLYVVGIFRSHTRDTNLVLADEDIDLFRRYTNDPSNLILLVRPFATKACQAGLFFEEDGQFRREHSYQEFPFRRRELGGAAPARAGAGEESSEAASSGEPDLRLWSQRLEARGGYTPEGPTAIPEENSPSARFRRKWFLIPLSFVFLLLGVVAGFQAALVLQRAEADKVAYESLGLGLEASRQADGILLRWDTNAPAVRYGKNAKLYIEDGEFRKTVALDSAQLQNGSVKYRGGTASIGFRLEVETQRRGFVTETLQFSPRP
jgi:hypothetical protein